MNDEVSPMPARSRLDERSADMVSFGVECWRHKWIFVLVFVICVVGACVVGVGKPDSYQYNVFVRIAGFDAVTGLKEVESANTVAAKIKEIDIPHVLAQSPIQYDFMRHRDVDVAVPSGTPGVTISTTAPLSRSQMVGRFLESVADAASTRLNAQLAAYVSAQKKFLQSEYKLVQSQIAELQDASKAALANGAGGAEAVYLSGEMGNLQVRASGIRQQLQVELTAAELQKAGIVDGIQRSQWPTGLGLAPIVILGVIVGIALGLIGVWLAGYIGVVRKRVTRESA